MNGQIIPSDFKRIYLAVKEYLTLTYRAIRSILKSDAEVVHISTSASYLLIKDIILVLFPGYVEKTVIHFHFGRIPDLVNGFSFEWLLLRFCYS